MDLRKRIIGDIEKGYKRKEVAEKYSVHYNTVSRLARQWKRTGNLEPKPLANGRKGKLTAEQLLAVEKIILERPDITVIAIIDELQLPIKESGLSKIIVKKLEFRFKKNSARQRAKQS
jgi:transposase